MPADASSFAEGMELVSFLYSGLSTIFPPLILIALGSCGLRLITAAEPDERKRGRISLITVLTASLLFELLPLFTEFLIRLAGALQ